MHGKESALAVRQLKNAREGERVCLSDSSRMHVKESALVCQTDEECMGRRLSDS